MHDPHSPGQVVAINMTLIHIHVRKDQPNVSFTAPVGWVINDTSQLRAGWIYAVKRTDRRGYVVILRHRLCLDFHIRVIT